MKTFSFIGSDKNVGKTTALNFVYSQLEKRLKQKTPICLTSTGVTGKALDSFDGRQKPPIHLRKGSCFVTSSDHLVKQSGKYRVLHSFNSPCFSKPYILGRFLTDCKIVLEGPNSKKEIVLMIKAVRDLFPDTFFLIDGSIDRQFLAHPDISSAFYFSIFVSNRKEQSNKARALLFPLSMPVCSEQLKKAIQRIADEDTKSIVFDKNLKPVFWGRTIPFLDSELEKKLEQHCFEHKTENCFLYLNGAIPRSFFSFLSGFKKLSVILDNFTLYQNVSEEPCFSKFCVEMSLLHPVKVEKIFIKQEKDRRGVADIGIEGVEFPKGVPVHNLFRENLYEIGI